MRPSKVGCKRALSVDLTAQPNSIDNVIWLGDELADMGGVHVYQASTPRTQRYTQHVAGTLKKTDTPRRMLHLTYTRRDLSQQLLQFDYLTPELYTRMSPVKRYLTEIEPPQPGDGVLWQPKKDHKG